jgi:hypothetical protein
MHEQCNSLEYIFLCLNSKHDGRILNRFGEDFASFASRTYETLTGGKFCSRPLFVQPSPVTYFSWQSVT